MSAGGPKVVVRRAGRGAAVAAELVDEERIRLHVYVRGRKTMTMLQPRGEAAAWLERALRLVRKEAARPAPRTRTAKSRV